MKNVRSPRSDEIFRMLTGTSMTCGCSMFPVTSWVLVASHRSSKNELIGNLIPSGLRQRMGGKGLGERGKLRGLPAPGVALDTTRFTIRTLHLRPVGTAVLARR